MPVRKCDAFMRRVQQKPRPGVHVEYLLLIAQVFSMHSSQSAKPWRVGGLRSFLPVLRVWLSPKRGTCISAFVNLRPLARRDQHIHSNSGDM